MPLVSVRGGRWVPQADPGGGGGDQPLLTADDITYLGYYDLAPGVGDPFYGVCIALRRVSGDLRLLASVFNGNGASTRPVCEFNLQGVSFGSTLSTRINTWNVATLSGSPPLWQGGSTAQEMGNAGLESLSWDSTNNVLLRHHMGGYPSGFAQAWVDVLSVPESGGSITRLKRVNIGDLMDSRINGGNSEIPADFQSDYGVGRWALGTGGYRSLEDQYGGGAPLGFTTYAVGDIYSAVDGSTMSYTTLSSHNVSNLGRRSWDGYTFTQTGSNTKTFTSTECNAPGGNPAFIGVTVPVGTFTGQGPIDYYRAGADPRGNGQSGATPTWDPVSTDTTTPGTSWGEIVPGQTLWTLADWYAGHAFLYGSGFTKRGVIAVAHAGVGRTWYSNSQVAVERYRLEMHIFDPVHLGEVALGTRSATSIQPVEIKTLDTEFTPGNSDVTGMPSFAFDPTTKRLYVMRQSYPSNPRILVYEVDA